MTATTDGAVVAGSKDKVAEFTAFYLGAFPDLAGYGLVLTGDPGAGDELAQDALADVYLRWDRLDSPRAYAFRIVANGARDRWRRRRRELATWAELVAHAAPAPELDPAVWDAVRRLPAPQRDAVLLYHLYDLPVPEVAVAVGRPVGTVKRHLSEARALLAAALEDTR